MPLTCTAVGPSIRPRSALAVGSNYAAAPLLNMTTDNVRYHERLGHLLALRVQRANGEYLRLFVKEDSERFQRTREKATEIAEVVEAEVA